MPTVFRSFKRSITSCGQWKDRLSELPDDVLFSIMSRLTIEEGARIATLSHKWKELWLYFPGIFNFEHSSRIVTLIEDIDRPCRSYPETASRFVSWVNHVVEQHVGPSIQEFKVIFDLDDGYQSQIDKWVFFALAKQAKSLVLDLNPKPLRKEIRLDQKYTLPLECCITLYNLSNAKTKHGLKTLNLENVNITTQVLDCFLHSCPFLENLLLRRLEVLTSIRSTSCPPLALKHLHVHDCSELQSIDIVAPKLLTFYYDGDAIQLHIRNAFLLSEVTVGGNRTEPIDYAFHAISEYYSQLEYLKVRAKLYSRRIPTITQSSQTNSVVPPVSNLTRLKHLVLTIYAIDSQSLLGWMLLVEASPVLQTITLELGTYTPFDAVGNTIGKRNRARPLNCLKTLEVRGFVGRDIDVEFVTYVFENAVVLKKVILDFDGLDFFNPNLNNSCAMRAAMSLRKKLPRGAELIIKEWHSPLPME